MCRRPDDGDVLERSGRAIIAFMCRNVEPRSPKFLFIGVM